MIEQYDLPPHTTPPLDANTLYGVRVRAIEDREEGEWSQFVFVTTMGGARARTNLSALIAAGVIP